MFLVLVKQRDSTNINKKTRRRCHLHFISVAKESYGVRRVGLARRSPPCF